MIEVYKFEADNEEECRIKCLDTLDVYNNEIITKEIEQEDKYVMEVLKKEDIKKFIEEYLNELAKDMNIELKTNIYEDENIFLVRINSKKNSILIWMINIWGECMKFERLFNSTSFKQLKITMLLNIEDPMSILLLEIITP